MKLAICELESAAPYGSSRFHDTPKLEKEDPVDYERRTWREKCHFDEKGIAYIPPMCFKKSLQNAAKMLSLKIPGKRNQTYTKNFVAGTLVIEGISLGVPRDKVEGEWLFLNADGVSGSGKRVKRCCPVFRSWKGTVTYHILDESITEDVFTKVLKESGQLIGIGRFRPLNGGFYGRFKVNKVVWKDA